MKTCLCRWKKDVSGKTATTARVGRQRSNASLVILLASVILVSSCMLPGASEFGAPGAVQPGDARFSLAPPNGAAILVPVKINGQGPYTFVFDTGATFTCIDEKLVEQLKLPESSGRVGVGIVVIEGAAKLVEVNSLEVGDATAKDLKACVIDFQRLQTGGLSAQGLIGLNFLKSYRVTIDFTTNVIHLEKTGK
jgi:predicted aspartyl protease